MILFLMLMLSIKSQAQGIEACLDSGQIHKVYEYRKDCEKCKLDLIDTNLALKDARASSVSQDHSITVVVGVVMFLVGALVGSSMK